MPTLANMIVKKADGVTDITWTGDVNSSGDKSPARYSSKSVTTIPAFQPKFSVSSEGSTDGGVRRIKAGLVYPVTVVDTTTNRTTEIGRFTFRGEWSIPQDLPAANADEFAAQLANIMVHAQMQNTVKTATAPT